MIEPALPRPLVRPRFLKGSLVVFALLMPFVVHAVFDYMESRRFADHLARIRENHEPISVQEIEPRWPLKGEDAEAERLYRAAAALSESSADDEARTRFSARLSDAIRSDTWPAELIAEMRRRVADRAEALRLLDHATRLDFDGFSPSASYIYRYADLFRLSQLARTRTVLLAIDGDGNRAADSAYGELRLAGARGVLPFPIAGERVASIAFALNHTSPDDPELARVAAGLKDLDRDEVMKNDLLRERAFFLDNVMRDKRRYGVEEWLVRSWELQSANQRLDRLAELIEASNRPWPRKLDPAIRGAAPPEDVNAMFRAREWGTLVATARALAFVRMTRVAVAGTRYRLAYHAAPASIGDLVPAYLDADPVDPFSGKSLQYTVEADGFSVRSEGWHRRVSGTRPDTVDPAIRIRAR